MKTDIKKLRKVIKELFKQFEISKDANDNEIYSLKMECIKDSKYKWCLDIVRNVIDRTPGRSTRMVIYNFLDDFLNLDEDAKIGDYEEVINDIEPDCYTYDLTGWLHESTYNVYYLTKVLEMYKVEDGFELLSAAQKMYFEEIGNNLLNELISYCNSDEFIDAEEDIDIYDSI